MRIKKVRVNSTYHYVPVMLDKLHPPIAVGTGQLASGDKVKVVNLPGCPKANTMGHAHFQLLSDSKFGGLCCANSLLTAEEYRAYLEMRIRDLSR
jgi:uncharacterized protein YwlG (UPF0340 family)